MYCLFDIIYFRTVNLTQLVKGLPKTAKLSSRYRRLQRLLSEWPSKTDFLCPWLLSWFYSETDLLSLTIDRTNWQWGKININFLMVGVVYKRMAIPLLWVLLPKKGNSNSSERIQLMKRLLKYVPKTRIKNLLCDREFVGHEWLNWLLVMKIPFKIRVKDNYLTLTSGGKETTIEALFYDLPAGQKKIIGKRPITNHGVKVYLTGSRLVSGELMVVVSNGSEEDAIECYCERWEIETLFQNLKGRGFDFEATHIICLEKLSALMSLTAIAACWCIRTGEWRIEQGELIRLKKHGRPSISLFRHGLDWLGDVFSGIIDQNLAREAVILWQTLLPPRISITL